MSKYSEQERETRIRRDLEDGYEGIGAEDVRALLEECSRLREQIAERDAVIDGLRESFWNVKASLDNETDLRRAAYAAKNAAEAETQGLREQIGEARKDSERLDWMIATAARIWLQDITDHGVKFVEREVEWLDDADREQRFITDLPTDREAIDAAMRTDPRPLPQTTESSNG